MDAFREGKFVIVYDADGREEECDFFLPAHACKPEHIRTMRMEGGGLIFLMVRSDIRDLLQLPFLQDMYPEFSDRYPVIKALVPDDIPYDTRSSFSVSINHRKTFTGITDNDRALTVREFGKLSGEIEGMEEAEAMSLFGDRFRSPGHVPICISSDRILETRFGHTELSCALSTMAGLNGVTVGCEMMGDDGKAKPKEEVKKYAKEKGIPFLEGKQIIEAWSEWEGDWKRKHMPPIATGEIGKTPGVTYSNIPPKKGKRVVATGVFDLLHPGHLHFLNQASELGDELVVIVARDSTVKTMKHHPVTEERIRRQMVDALEMTDFVVLGYEGDRFRIIQELRPDVIALGYDQEPDTGELERELQERNMDVEIVRLSKMSGDIAGTTQIIERIRKRGNCN